MGRIEHIRLDDFSVYPSLHGALLSSPRHLRTFSVTIASGEWRGGWFNLILILLEHQPGLEALKIKEQVKPRKYRPMQLGSLASMDKLTYLAVPLELLIRTMVFLFFVCPLIHKEPNNAKEEIPLGTILPSSLDTLVLSKGQIPYLDVFGERFNQTMCDYQIESLLEACQNDNIRLKTLGILYTTSFPDRVNNFTFYEIAEKSKSCGIHFDYVIDVSTWNEFIENAGTIIF
jgi:hypothetical protein